MNIEDQVTSLELSNELKKFGIKQDSLFCYIDNRIYTNYESYLLSIFRDPENIKLRISAFTASELLELLPEYITIENIKYELIISKYAVVYNQKHQSNWLSSFCINIFNKTLTDCLAKMIIHLIENKLMDIKND
ncbi:MAG TPA: hypothetical protein VNF93_02440 [Buchnera sp. (in: enterobacteria)]|nr:hypothetical protein [Buchnera sp. (in: enterobacteria)]